MDFLQKESVYLEQQPCNFKASDYRYNNEKFTKRSNCDWKDSMENYNAYTSFFASKTYSNVSSSILSYIVGGFVGSKIQMNNNKKHIVTYNLSAVISNLLNPWKFEQEKTNLKKNSETFMGSSSKINFDCYDQYIFNKSVQETPKVKECLVNLIDVECLVTVPLSNFESSQVSGPSKSNFEKRKRDNLNKLENCDTKKVIVSNSSSDKFTLKSTQKSSNTEIKTNTNTEYLYDNQYSKNQCKVLCPIINSEKLFDYANMSVSSNMETKIKFRNCDSPSVVPIVESENRRQLNGFFNSERCRQQSECSIDSSDSDGFIVFEDIDDEGNGTKEYKTQFILSAEKDLVNIQEDEDSEDIEDYIANEVKDLDDFSDDQDLSPINKDIAEANARWNNKYNDTSVKTFKRKENEVTKKVKFNDRIKVNKIIAWNHAYRLARLGPWEQIARDRVRFQDRISRLSLIISPILSETHRSKIYKKLYS